MEKVEKNDKVMKTSLVVLVAVVLIFAGALVFAGKNASVNQNPVVRNDATEKTPASRDHLKNVVANIGGTHLMASVADSEGDRRRGLSNVTSISPNEGQMFTFETEDFHAFHMKDMKFALDFIFVNDQGTVVDIIKNVAPDHEGVITPAYPASTVFEVNAGWADQNKIKVGDTVVSTEMDQK